MKPYDDGKCALCGKSPGYHNATTKACPFGRKTRAGYTLCHPTRKFTPKTVEAK